MVHRRRQNKSFQGGLLNEDHHKPASKRLIQSIVDSQNIIGNGYVARYYCAAYHMEFRSDENSIEQLLAGQLTVHTLFAPYIPAETIENIREYDVSALESVIGG